MTRLTSDERRAIELEIDSCQAEIRRLQSLLDSQPDGSDGDTIRLLQPLCACGLPLDHRHPMAGVPRSCADATERIAFAESRSRPPVPSSVTGDERCWCEHLEVDHIDTVCEVGTCQCGGFDTEGIRR